LPLEISEDIQPEEKKRNVARTKTIEVNIIFIHITHYTLAIVMYVSVFRIRDILRRIRILGSVH
jgi:hypothetical protein